MRWFLVPLFACFRLDAQPATQDELLERIRLHMLANLEQQPNYTCTETIERYYRSGPTRKFQLSDTLRLEVALVDGQEMFAFPGAKKFDSVPLTEMVGDTGAISNGDFALHARSVFAGRGPKFEYKGEETDGGRKRIRFDYDVALQASNFELKHGPNKALTAYHGWFEVDASTFDLARLVVIAEDIAPAIGIKKTVKDLSFARLKIGDGEFLLPAESELTITEMNGGDDLNRSKFSGCRQFTGESTLTFEEPAAAASAPAPIQEVTLPGKIDLPLALNETIDPRKAAVGDPVTARLISDVKSKARLIVPKGAVARGRITRAEQHRDGVLLGIEFLEIEWPASHALLSADLTMIQDGNSQHPLRFESSDRPHEAVLPLTSQRINLPRGLLMYWTTAP